MEKEKHYEELIKNMIDYLWEIWNNETLEDIEKKFKFLGFLKEDLEFFYIKQDIEELKREIEQLRG